MKHRFQFNTLPKLQESETVLLFLPWVWAMSSRSTPLYRVFASAPPLSEAGLYITNRRLLVLASVLRLVSQEASLWFPGFGNAEEDVIRFSSVGESNALGPYLDVVSTNSENHWYRSRELRVRLYTRHAHQAHAIIGQLLASREFVNEEEFVS